MRLVAWKVAAVVGVQAGLVEDVGARAQESIWSRDGASYSDMLGGTVSGAGDVDHDGLEDVLATEGDDNGYGNGRANVFHGSDGSDLFRIDPPDTNNVNFATSAAGVGDLDGDGFDDFVVGDRDYGGASFPSRGAIYAFSGKDGSLLYRKLGPIAADRLGWKIGRLGDLNGDGRPEYLVSARQHLFDSDSVPYVRVCDGPTGDPIYSVFGVNAGDSFGASLASNGDLDGDSIPDFAVGCEWRNYVLLFSGATGALIRELDSPDPQPYAFGSRIAIGGDLDGDGIPETLVADPYRDDGTVRGAGLVYVFAGSDGSLLTTLRTANGLEYDYFGFAITALDDANGDGVGDFAISRLNDRHGGVQLHSGRTGALLYFFPGYPNHGQRGSQLAGLRDADGDGLGDLLIGSPMKGAFDNGNVDVRASHTLFLDVEPELAVAGDLVTRTVREGVAANKVGVALVGVNGTPTFLFLEGLGAFGGAGSYELDATLPPGLGALSLDFQGFAIDGRGKVVATTVERIELQ